jgi:uncharacterized OB-fold protein
MAETSAKVLTAPNNIEYPFRRTTGEVVGAFFTALRDGYVVGIKGADGRVIVPPVEYDPVTAEPLTEVVEVGDAGTVVTWAWTNDPLPDQPLDRPFAWAMVKLDGADTPMLHVVDTDGDESAMKTGMRVQAKWRAARPAGDEGDVAVGTYREGNILDIECFVAETAGGGA